MSFSVMETSTLDAHHRIDHLSEASSLVRSLCGLMNTQDLSLTLVPPIFVRVFFCLSPVFSAPICKESLSNSVFSRGRLIRHTLEEQ